MTALTLALDWTPNTNHAGFFVAQSQGLYQKQGLNVKFLSPHTDEYKTTPASRVNDGTATFAVCPSESVISYNTWPVPGVKAPIKAIATLLQRDTSAVVTLASSGIDRPAQLDGKKYASYGARFEGRIVQQLIQNDGGKGEYIEDTPPMLGIWNTLLEGGADATWVFMGWEGVEAQLKGVELNAFYFRDHNVPYGYSPVLVAHPDTLRDNADAVRKFLAATAEGYKIAAADPQIAAQSLRDTASALGVPEVPSAELAQKSAEYLSKEFLTAGGDWGRMDGATWDSFLDWLSQKGLLTSKVQSRAVDDAGVTTSLDGLRGGDVGEAIPRGKVHSSDLFSNGFLP